MHSFVSESLPCRMSFQWSYSKILCHMLRSSENKSEKTSLHDYLLKDVKRIITGDLESALKHKIRGFSAVKSDNLQTSLNTTCQGTKQNAYLYFTDELII